MARLLWALSGHGFGHLAQCAPLINRLGALGFSQHLVSALPRSRIETLVAVPFSLTALETDPGMAMVDALRVDGRRSLAAYEAYHQRWPEPVEAWAALIAEQAPALVISNVAYAPLLAARQLGIGAVALCSLDWYHITSACLGRALADEISVAIKAAYASAECFFCPEPSMPMPGWHHVQPLGPVAQLRPSRAHELRQRLGLSQETRLVLVALGGVITACPWTEWPAGPWHWLVPDAWVQGATERSGFSDLGMSVPELLASADLVITKPGYGTFVEAACHGVPVLYLERPDWPEAPALCDWLEAQGAGERLSSGAQAMGAQLEHRAGQRAPWAQPRGVDQFVAWVQGRLSA